MFLLQMAVKVKLMECWFYLAQMHMVNELILLSEARSENDWKSL